MLLYVAVAKLKIMGRIIEPLKNHSNLQQQVVFQSPAVDPWHSLEGYIVSGGG